jgi:hypothetical protein
MSGGGHNMLQHLTITQMQVPVIGTGNSVMGLSGGW